VTEDGAHCIVGEVLAQAGVSNIELEGDPNDGRSLPDNTTALGLRPDLVKKAQAAGLSPTILREAQREFDSHQFKPSKYAKELS
jgi:hypothetical protein